MLIKKLEDDTTLIMCAIKNSNITSLPLKPIDKLSSIFCVENMYNFFITGISTYAIKNILRCHIL